MDIVVENFKKMGYSFFGDEFAYSFTNKSRQKTISINIVELSVWCNKSLDFDEVKNINLLIESIG